MKFTWPPLQCERVGFDANQHGHAASQEQASSITPEIFQGAFFSPPARTRALLSRHRTARIGLAVRMTSPPSHRRSISGFCRSRGLGTPTILLLRCLLYGLAPAHEQPLEIASHKETHGEAPDLSALEAAALARRSSISSADRQSSAVAWTPSMGWP